MTSALRLHTPRFALVDALRQEHASALVQVAGIVGFALLTVLGAQVRVFFWEVPVSLLTMAAYGSGLFLGWRNGMLAQLLYLSLGLFFPVFAGDVYGPAYLFTAVSAGYLVALPFAAAVIGALSRRWNTLVGSTLALIVGGAIVFSIGVVWLHYAAGHATWLESLDKGFFRFILIDAAKILLLGVLYAGTRKLT